MAPSSLTLQYDALLSTTLFNYRRAMEDAISTSNALLFYLMKKTENGYKKVTELGERMAMPLMYELGKADSYSGYDQLNTSPAEGLTMAFYDWRQAAVPISISGREKKLNRGQAKIIDLLETKTMQAKLGIQEFFNKRMLQGLGGSSITSPYVSPMNGSTFVDPLPKLVAYDPTAALTVGNIPQATYAWWRNQTSSFSAVTTFKGYRQKLRQLRNNCGKGPGGYPDLYVATQGSAELYVAALEAMHQNPSYNVADIPFDNVSFFGKPMVWDDFMPDFGDGTVTQTKGSVVMLNTQFWGVRVDSETNFAPTEFQTPVGQDASIAHILWMGSVGMSNRRKQGVGGLIDETISA